jgi:hypothetical protein
VREGWNYQPSSGESNLHGTWAEKNKRYIMEEP